MTTDPTIATITKPEDAELARELRYWAKENTQVCGDVVARRIPARYVDAVVTNPEIQDWVRALVAEADALQDMRYSSAFQDVRQSSP